LLKITFIIRPSTESFGVPRAGAEKEMALAQEKRALFLSQVIKPPRELHLSC